MTLNITRSNIHVPHICVASVPQYQISVRFTLQPVLFELQAILRQAHRMTHKSPLNTAMWNIPHICATTEYHEVPNFTPYCSTANLFARYKVANIANTLNLRLTWNMSWSRISRVHLSPPPPPIFGRETFVHFQRGWNFPSLPMLTETNKRPRNLTVCLTFATWNQDRFMANGNRAEVIKVQYTFKIRKIPSKTSSLYSRLIMMILIKFSWNWMKNWGSCSLGKS